MSGHAPPTVATLRRITLFDTLSDTELARLASHLLALHVPAGGIIVRQGAHDRALYGLLSGRARVSHGSVSLGVLEQGAHFGDVGWLTGAERSASVVAESTCELVVLDAEMLDRCIVTHPHMVVRLLRALVAGSGARLGEMNATVSAFLKVRGLARRPELTVQVGDVSHTVRNGTVPSELLPARLGEARVVAALVDGRTRALDLPLAGDCELAPLSTAHWEGQRIYRRSLCLATLEAAESLGIALRVGASLGLAQRLLTPPGADVAVLAERLQAALEALVERDVPVVRETLGLVEAYDHFEQLGWHDAAQLMRTTRATHLNMASYGGLYVWEARPLVPRTGALEGFAIAPDGDDLLLVYAVPGSGIGRSAPGGGLPAEVVRRAWAVARQTDGLMRQQALWLKTLGIRSVGDFNQRCIEGRVAELIQVAEGAHEKAIGALADTLAAAAERLRVVCIAGPSSSGKSTFIRRLKVQLQVNGLNPRSLGLDDYYCDREVTPLDEEGDYDFEAVEALRLDLLRDHLARLAAGERVKTARFDFREGRSYAEGGPELQLGPQDLLLIEGIHGLNPALSDHLPLDQAFRIFVSPLAQLPLDALSHVHASDVRLLRRIVRDRHGRSKHAADTILRWPKVRAGERKHIHPYQGNAHAVFDTSLVYEVAVLKVYAERYLLEVPPHHPAQATAERLLTLLDRWITVYPDHVPPTSILREFMGGSGFGE
jgi:uridine kinase